MIVLFYICTITASVAPYRNNKDLVYHAINLHIGNTPRMSENSLCADKSPANYISTLFNGFYPFVNCHLNLTSTVEQP